MSTPRNLHLLILGLALLACQERPAPETPRSELRAEALSGLDRGVFFDRGRDAVATGWEASPDKLRASYCASCHAESHAGWAGGMHAQAWTDPVFLEAFDKEEMLWCVNCHAPLQTQREIYFASKREGPPHPEADLLAEGINCAACHVRDGQIHGTRSMEATGEGHAVVASEHMASPAFCADCHQFNFPSFRSGKPRQISYTPEPMQNTYGEWHDFAPGVACRSCHYREHRLMGPHDKDWMRSKFRDVRWSVEDDLLLRVRFKVAPRGHFTPSGDLFHSLALEVSPREDFSVLTTQHKWARFYRTGFLEPGVVWDRVLFANKSLRPDQREVAVTVDLPQEGSAYARLVYYYHDHHLGGRFDSGPELQYLVLWSDTIRP